VIFFAAMKTDMQEYGGRKKQQGAYRTWIELRIHVLSGVFFVGVVGSLVGGMGQSRGVGQRNVVSSTTSLT
jgi:hypothetical protein